MKLTVRIKPSKYAKNKKAVVADQTLRWYTTDKTVAAVDQTGTITPTGKPGKCGIYARAHNGNCTVKTRVKVADFARPKKFKNVEYMQEDMQKLIKSHEDDLKVIAAFFEKNRAQNKEGRQMINFWLNDARTDLSVGNHGDHIDYKSIREVLYRVLDSYPGEMQITATNEFVRFELYGESTSVVLIFGLGLSNGKELEDNRDHFKAALRWYYRLIRDGA